MTHRCCSDSIDFERYELLGDSFLKFAVAKFLFQKDGGGTNEGAMSVDLHRLVSNGTLYRAALVRSYFISKRKSNVFGYLYPLNIILDNEQHYFQGDLTDTSAKSKTLLVSNGTLYRAALVCSDFV